ncbi:MAG: hypothetical protein JAZ17_05550 [Candidatus Thiodiazotropha endolucinida]|nr:hypothetical protein [Candidatus Thiodiazotropha endolucinida]
MEENPRETWEPLVGRFVLTCGDVELALLQVYWNLSLHGQYEEKIKLLGLGKKAKFIRERIPEFKLNKDLIKRVDNALSESIQLAHQRNLVAHNPLYLDVYSDEKGNFTLVPTIRSLRDDEKHISLEDLINLNTKASKLSSELQKMVIEVADAQCPVT